MAGGVTSQERHEARFQELLEAVSDATIMVTADGRIALANTQAEILFGYERHELIGQPVEILVPDAVRGVHARHRESYASPTTPPMGVSRELAGRHRSGAEFPVDVSLTSVETEEGPLVAAAVRDITDRKRIERTLQEKNAELERASSAKDRFLASMSHELRTPLNAILGFSGTLLMGLPGPLNKEQEGQLRTVRDSARHLLAIINDLLDLAKIESGKVELALDDVDCESVVRETAAALRPLAEAKGLTFDLELPEEPVVAHADPRLLGRVLACLTGNAIKFTERGGVRLVLTRGTDGDRPTVTFEVIDTGMGISAADQERLFDAFEQLGDAGRHQEGTGLGLHISRRLVEILGGTIVCHSVPGQGSTFKVALGGR